MPLVLANANVLWIFITLLLLAKIHVLNRDVGRKLQEEKFNRYTAFTHNKTETSSTTEQPQNNNTTSTSTLASTSCKFEDDIKNMMYRHPDFPFVRGRPFSGLETHAHILEEYLNAKTVVLDANHKITPQPITGVSANHFLEHQANARIFFELFPDKKILFMDLGLTKLQIDKIKEDKRYIYKKLDFTKYPEKTTWLTNMAFKVFSIMECLMAYQACMHSFEKWGLG